jgi:hypothetical protein
VLESTRPRARIRLLAAGVLLLALPLPSVAYYAWKAVGYTQAAPLVQRGALLESDRALGFRPARNSVAVRQELWSGHGYSVFTDRLGARVDRPGAQTPERVDLLTVGCSFAWGHGVRNEETFTQVLGRELGRPVANFGFPSWGPLQCLRVLEGNASLHPRVVIYAFIGDHIRRALSPCAPSYAPTCLAVPHIVVDEAGRAQIEEADMSLFALQHDFMETFLGGSGSPLHRVLLAFRVDVAGFQQRHLGFRFDAAARSQAMRLVIPRLSSAARNAGATLVIVAIPYFEPGLTQPAPPELTEAIDSLGAQAPLFLDLAPRVADYNARFGVPLGLPRDGVPAHPGRLGHQLIADALREFLEERRLLPRGEP